MKKKIERINSSLLQDSGLAVTTRLRNIAYYHAVTDCFAVYLNFIKLLAFIVPLISAIVALLSFLVYLEFSRKPVLIAIYFLALGLGAVWYLIAHRKKYDRKHEDYRAFAESFRVQFYLSIIKQGVNVYEYSLQKNRVALEWRVYALRAALLKSGKGENVSAVHAS